MQAVRQESGRHGASLMHGRLLSLEPGRVRLGFTRAAAFHRTAVAGSTGKALIEKALTEHFGQPTVVELEPDTAVADAAEPSLAEFQSRAREAHERSTDNRVRSHPAVMAALSLLGGKVEHIQVLQPDARPAVPDEPTDD